jgi:hypothetical protein
LVRGFAIAVERVAPRASSGCAQTLQPTPKRAPSGAFHRRLHAHGGFARKLFSDGVAR